MLAVSFQGKGRREARHVLENLRLDDDLAEENEEQVLKVRDFLLDHPLAKYGLYTEASRKNFKKMQRILVAVPFMVALLVLLFLPPSMPAIRAPLFLLAFGVAVIVQRLHLRHSEAVFLRSLDFYLPILMERLVMAVQAGLDVLPAIKVTLETEDYNKPAATLLRSAYQLTESGVAFDEALKLIATKVSSNALRHAFVHLGLAHKEGGELIGPLRELSDATQNYFQESTEEEIAKLPVKATLPLLCTFAGLIISFLVSPLLQLMNLTTQAGAGLP